MLSMQIQPPQHPSSSNLEPDNSSLFSPPIFQNVQINIQSSEQQPLLSPENDVPSNNSSSDTSETSKATCSIQPDTVPVSINHSLQQDTSTSFGFSNAAQTSPSSSREEILKSISHNFIHSIFHDEIQDTLERFVTSVAFKQISDIAIRFHREAFKTAEIAFKESQNDSDATEDEDETFFEKKLECEFNDPFRKQILKDWDTLKQPYDQKLNWLEFKLKQLNHELAVTEDSLQKVAQSLNNSPPSVNYKFVNGNTFPLEDKKSSYLKHPIFIEHELKEKTARMHRDDIISSFKLFHLEFPRRRKQKPTSSSHSQLYVDIPEHNQITSPVLLEDNLSPSYTEEYETPKRKKKATSSHTPSSSKKYSSSTSHTTTPNSSRRIPSRRQQGSVDDIVVPWGDIRSNATIEEVKPKEIYTPNWRVMDTYSPLFPKPDMLTSTTTSPRQNFEKSDTNYQQFGEEEEEDISDEVYCRLHIPEEFEERKKVYDYYMSQSINKNKKKKDSLSFEKFKTKEEIHATFERYRQTHQIQDKESTTILHNDITPILNTSQKSPQPISAYKINNNTVIPRHYQLEISSYIPADVPDPFAIRGNFEEMGVRMKEEQIRQQKLKEERLKSKTYSKSHQDSHGNEPEDYLVDLENAVISDEDGDENMDDFIQDVSDDESEDSDFGAHINGGDYVSFSGSSNRKKKKARRREANEITKKQKVCTHKWVYVKHVGELRIVLKREDLSKQ